MVAVKYFEAIVWKLYELEERFNPILLLGVEFRCKYPSCWARLNKIDSVMMTRCSPSVESIVLFCVPLLPYYRQRIMQRSKFWPAWWWNFASWRIAKRIFFHAPVSRNQVFNCRKFDLLMQKYVLYDYVDNYLVSRLLTDCQTRSRYIIYKLM